MIYDLPYVGLFIFSKMECKYRHLFRDPKKKSNHEILIKIEQKCLSKCKIYSFDENSENGNIGINQAWSKCLE
jgi:hypothetical protein